jgi:hypothetical protein
MGDFNAKVGTDNIEDEDVIGKHGPGQRNENGERFSDLCSLNQIVISLTNIPIRLPGDPLNISHRVR